MKRSITLDTERSCALASFLNCFSVALESVIEVFTFLCILANAEASLPMKIKFL